MSVYVNGWRMCPFCEENRALDGHLTCAQNECEETFYIDGPGDRLQVVFAPGY